jgi:hypothetical protein
MPTQVRLVHELGRVQGLARSLPREPCLREPAQLVVDQREQLLRGGVVARLDRVQDAGDVGTSHDLIVRLRSFARTGSCEVERPRCDG